MRQRGFPAVFMRGGTSKALVFHERDLPADRGLRDALFLAALGSPDPGQRQLDGLGGGVSSLSKVCIVAPSARADADVDYTFAQVPVRGTRVDYSANCGNMSSAIGPFAVEEGLVRVADGEARVRIHNTNTGKLIVARFAVAGGLPLVEGDFVNPGVAGSGAPIRLDFQDPGGAAAGRLLPSGCALDRLEHPLLERPVPASLIDAANPCVFVAAADLGLDGRESAAAIEAEAGLMERLELLRRLASVAMGIAPDLEQAAAIEGIPKIGLVSAPRDYVTPAGEAIAGRDHDVAVRMLSMGQAHRAIPLTAALCTAVAAALPGSLVAEACGPGRGDGLLRIGHASGTLPVAAAVAAAQQEGTAADGSGWRAVSATVFRTARRLMEGRVLVPAGSATKA